jgi:hypothetical protein
MSLTTAQRRAILDAAADAFPNAAPVFAAIGKIELYYWRGDEVLGLADDLRHAAHDVACAYEDETAGPCQATIEHYRAEAAE